MAVIIREERDFEGVKRIVKVYKTSTGKLLTAKDKDNAGLFDKFLSDKIKSIEAELYSLGYLKLKGKPRRVLRLWYEVGARLDFVSDTSVIAAADRDIVWRAIYDHTTKLAPGPLTERVKRDPASSHFSYCYRLAQFPWEFVNNVGDWTSWCEFFDRRETKNDPRIIKWLSTKAENDEVKNMQDWLRPLTKAIHNDLKGVDTTILTKAELEQRLDSIFEKI